MAEQYVASRTLYMDADRENLVEEGSDDAAYLLVREGASISPDDLAGYGLKWEDVKGNFESVPSYNARVYHEALHANESEREAEARRAAMFEGAGENRGVTMNTPAAAQVENVNVEAKSVPAAPANKAQLDPTTTKAPANAGESRESGEMVVSEDAGQQEEARAAGDVDATDGARELAEEEGIDLVSVQGSGADGRITKADVEKASRS